VRASGQTGADEADPLSREERRESERARASDVWRRQVGPTWRRADAGAGARGLVGWAEWAERPRKGGDWAPLSFSFIMNFLIPFPFVFSFGFKFKHATNSISCIPNMCIK
jgi:hypothetical protein